MSEERVAALERQVRVMAHMLAARDEAIRQLEFERLAKQIEIEEAGGELAVVSPADDEDEHTESA